MRKVMILGGTGLVGKCFLIWKNKKELVNSLRIWINDRNILFRYRIN